MEYKKYLEQKSEVQGFFDQRTNTISYVVADVGTKKCAIVDSVMDFDSASGTIYFENADAIVSYIEEKGYSVEWILETHVHADHLSAAPYLKDKMGGDMAIGEHIIDVQNTFGKVFNEGTKFKRDGSQFDRLWVDGDTFSIGNIPALVIHTPGHTPADVVYVIGDAVFAGDTMFMPDFGSARCDFPGGDPETLYESVQKIFVLPDEMRMFMCHDYLPEGRDDYQWETTVGEQRRQNVHLHKEVSSEQFIEMRSKRDDELGMPNLIIPSIQVNMRAGSLPETEDDGQVFMKVPVNGAFSKNK